MINTGYY